MSSYSTTDFGVDRRRRLFSTLQPILPGDQVWRALWVWERDFAEQAPFAVADYGKRIASELGMPGSEQALLAHITAGMQAPASSLLEDPIQTMLENPFVDQVAQTPLPPVTGTPTPAPTPALLPQDLVFNTMVDKILGSVSRQEPGVDNEIRRHLASSSSSFSDSARRAVAAWAQGQSTHLTGFTKADMGGLLNAVYVWVCEEVGPNKVDRIFGDAVRVAESLPEASGFSPRSLL